MFSYKLDIFNNGLAQKFRINKNAEPMRYADALDLWQHSDSFRSFFISILTDAPFSAYRWETPPLTLDSVNRDFEFVLLDSPFLDLPPEPEAFASYFTSVESDAGIVVFENLGKDAVLVAPTPQAPDSAYPHIAAFTRNGPGPQNHDLWRTVGRTMQQRITNRPVWLSTAGGGVAWLHVRLDCRPKYYGFSPYRELP